MARSIADIQTQITKAYVSNMAAIGITINTAVWSATNITRVLFYTVAFCVYVLETLFDLHYADTEALIKAKNPATVSWYQDKCLNFQLGFDVDSETGEFINGNATAQQIEDSKVVKYAAVQKQVNIYGRVLLRIKVAGYNGTDLTQLPAPTVAALLAYFNSDKIAPAGEHLTVQSLPPDDLKMTWLIKYNPLVLNAAGQRLDGSSATPVQDAVKNYLTKTMQFGGAYIPTFHVDAVQAVQGVQDAVIESCQARYGSIAFANVNDEYLPDGGYLRFANANDLNIVFEPF